MDNVEGVAESPLLVFGGLVAEVDPPSIPAGSAAICTDIDFTVASAHTRDGIQNVYVYDGFDIVANAGHGADIAVTSGEAWTNPNNIIHDSPPTYASVTLNAVPVTPAVGNTNGVFTGSPPTLVSTIASTMEAIGIGDKCLVFVYNASTSGPAPVITSFTDSLGSTYALVSSTTIDLSSAGSNGYLAIYEATFTSALAINSSFAVTMNLSNSDTVVGSFNFCTVSGIGSVIGQVQNTGVFTPTQPNSGASGITLATSALLFSFEAGFFNFLSAKPTGFTIGGGTDGDFGGNFAYQSAGPGSYTDTWTLAVEGSGQPWGCQMIAFALATSPASSFSDILQATNYGGGVPLTSVVLGMEFEISGLQSASSSENFITLQPIGGSTPADIQTAQLPATQGTVTLGGPGSLFGVNWTAAQINDPSFGADMQAFSSGLVPTTFDIAAVIVTVWYTPPNIENFNFVGSFEMTTGDTLNLALDSSGVIWQEDVDSTPNVLTAFYSEIEPNTFAKMTVQDDRAFLALSDLNAGTDMPRGYNGQWIDRLSQVGPGIAPVFTATTTEYTIVNITQPAAVTNSGTGNPIRALLWSSGPGVNNHAGNVITVYYKLVSAGSPDPNIYVGGGVVLSGFTTHGGNDPNGSYLVTSIQQTNSTHGLFYTFCVQAPNSFLTDDDPPNGASYQASLATLTLSAPSATVQVGTQIDISGTGVSDLNATWTVLNALNAAQLQITATSLTSGVATYNFTLISGTAPTAGEQVTITGTTNGDGIFNLSGATISSASPSSFSISISSPDIPAAAEPNGQAVISGTEFQFDPAPTWVDPADPSTPTEAFIFGTSTGGNLVQAGQLGAGTRMGTVLFLTRNGFLTAPAPPATFTLNEGASSIVASNIPLGPPNVIARVIALTGAGGAFFFWLPTPVTVTSNGQQVTYDATIINDNVTTQATFSITDAVLLAGLSIDTDGSDNFAQIELGSSIGLISYAERIFAYGEQNKIQNFNNLSFDGGYLNQNLTSPIEPAGWTVDPTNGTGGSLAVSPLFGNAYYIQNASGSTQAVYGMITQTAYQDSSKVAILNPQTTYGVRVTADIPSGLTGGNLVVDLFSPSFGAAFGTATIPFSELLTSMRILTLDLLTTAFTTQVPNDLQLRVYATAIVNGADVMIDRLEVFDLTQPVLTTQLRGSYFNNFEAFDGVTGNLGVGAQNQQPVRNAFTLFDNLYIVKTKSFISTSDNGTTEPNFWNVREVSNKVGTPSVNGVDVGEGWALIAGPAGLYLFQGGDPIKISPEIDPLWAFINWSAGQTIWLRNDTINRKIYVGVPIPTPNQWMPRFPSNQNPQQPNVVLMCQYKELMTAGALSSEGPLRVAYTGELKSFPLGRKWSAWSIEACFADFITRPSTLEPIFFCGDQGTGKIYQQIAGVFNDDGEAMHCQYVTYPFPKTQEAQQMQMGMHQLLAHFMSLLVIGEGELRPTIYPDNLTSIDQEALFPEPLLDPPPYGDVELPLNIEGNRFFVGLEVTAVDEWFDVSRIVMAIGPNPWAPVRGGNG